MDLTILEAAARLGKSDRQIRYLIAKQEIKARKVNNTWLIDAESLPLSEGQTNADALKKQMLVQRAETAVGAEQVAKLLGSPEDKRGYSMMSLRSFPICLEIYNELRQTLEEGDPALFHLREALEFLATGCHRFHKTDKSEAYHSARDSLSRSVVYLLASGTPANLEVAQRLELHAIPAVSNLMSRLEKK